MATVRSGPASVVDAGSVTGFAAHPVDITATLRGARFTVRFVFTSTEDGQPGVSTTLTPEKLEITCANFDTAEGKGSSSPVLLGEAGEHLLFFHFRVFRYGRTDDRTVHYTFFEVLKADIGWTPADD